MQVPDYTDPPVRADTDEWALANALRRLGRAQRPRAVWTREVVIESVPGGERVTIVPDEGGV